MQFRRIRDSVRRTLFQHAHGEFNVVGFQKRGKGASWTVNKGRLVEVYFTRGTFPKTGGSVNGPNKHNISIRIDLTVSQPAKGDIDTIKNPAASADEIARALSDMKEADLLADESMDELFELVYNILMDARNETFDLKKGQLASRWVSDLTKDDPISRGNYTILTGNCLLTCTASEQVEGYKGVEVDPNIDVTLELETDIPGKAGVQTGA